MNLCKIETILSLVKYKIFEESHIINSIKQKCCYDERNDIKNFEENLAEIFN